MEAKLNPEITEVNIGIRELRPVKLYPLSFRDQMKTSDLIGEAMQKLLEAQAAPDVVFVKEILDMITRNADWILDLVTDKEQKGDDILAELTNQQLLTIAETIWEVNYAHLQKKIQTIVGALEAVSGSLPTRPLPPLSGDTLSTDLRTSIKEVGEKAG